MCLLGRFLSVDNVKNHGQWRDSFHVVIAGSNGYVSNRPCPVDYATSAILANTLQPYCSSLLGYTTPVTTLVSTELTAVPSTTITVTSVPLTTETVTTTTLSAVTNQMLKRDLTKPTAASEPKLRRDVPLLRFLNSLVSRLSQKHPVFFG